jgi:hypothetical protein
MTMLVILRESPASSVVDFNKLLYGAVISPFHISREVAGRQLTQLLVINNTFAANTLPGTRFVGAVALRLILLNFAFSHYCPP